MFRIFYSKVSSYLTCRKQYWYRYVSGLEWPEKIATPAGCIGTGIHEAMQVLCECGEPEVAEQRLRSYLAMPKHECAGPGTEAYGIAFQLFERGCEAHASIESTDRWAEVSTWAPWPARGVTLSAKADRVDLMPDGSYQVVDWKTGRVDFGNEIDAQLEIAHVAFRIARSLPHETPVTAIGWNLRTEQKRVRALTRADASATMRYYAGLADRMQMATEFEATPGSACGFCEWRDQCAEAASVESRTLALLEDDEDEWDGDLGEVEPPGG